MTMKPIRGYNRFEMLYPDRCMMKWKGMLLADHTEHIHGYAFEKKETLQSVEGLDAQMRDQMDQLIAFSLACQIKLKFLLKDEEIPIEGVVVDLLDDALLVKANDMTIKMKRSEVVDIFE